jgi:hypothetical protein
LSVLAEPERGSAARPLRGWERGEQASPGQLMEHGIKLRRQVKAEPLELDSGEEPAPRLDRHVDGDRFRGEGELLVAEHVPGETWLEEVQRVSERRLGRQLGRVWRSETDVVLGLVHPEPLVLWSRLDNVRITAVDSRVAVLHQQQVPAQLRHLGITTSPPRSPG